MRIVQKLVAIILDLIIFIISVLVIIAGIYAVQTKKIKKENHLFHLIGNKMNGNNIQ